MTLVFMSALTNFRWRVFHRRIALPPDTTRIVVKACIAIHNLLQKKGETPCTNEPKFGAFLELPDEEEIMSQIGVRNKFKKYFACHPVSWQKKSVELC